MRLLSMLSFSLFVLFGCNDNSFSGGGEKTSPGIKSSQPKSEDAKKHEKEPKDDDSNLDGEDDQSVDDSDDDLPETVSKDDVLSPIDSNCVDSKNDLFGGIFSGPIAPKVDLPRTAPDSCEGGIEFNNLKNSTFALSAKSTIGKKVPLDVEIASYTAADRMRIFAVFTDGQKKLILDSCRLRTASYVDPTNGNKRPPEDSIRDFRVVLPKGVESLEFDFGAASTPTYMKVNGLCDFKLSPKAVSGGTPSLRTF